MRYELFSQHDGFRWRFVSQDGEILAAASRSLSREQCMKAIQILRMTVGAPIVVVPEAPAEEKESHADSHRRAA
jgi:uncharacterized protein YegP (UPF0339 family)